MKTCPTCGFRSNLETCPKDGERMLTDAELAASVSGEAPTLAPEQALDVARAQAVAEELAAEPSPQPEATQKLIEGDETPRGAQKPSGGDDKPQETQKLGRDEDLRGEDFGKWAAPTIKKKTGDPMIGRTIAGRYEVLSLLGRGGMGAVYKARQPSVQRMIALKVLLKEFADNETVIKRFHQEALAASRLTHPNTISVYDFGQSEDGILYMAMEFLKGMSLADAVRGGPMPPKRVTHIMRQVCKSLAEAHRAGIIHRDLKPDNIFLTDIQGERDYVKVLDFGVAKLREYEGKEGTLTQAGMIFGTPKYMSPEQARSTDLDARSDVYALGVILYEMLLGQAPFSGDNPLSILIAHVNETPRSFAEVNPQAKLPAPLEAVVMRAMAKKADARCQTVEELHAQLEACDELLGGASYASVAGRLPAIVPGAGGALSLAGPAIVPEGSDVLATTTGQRKGDTVALDESGRPLARTDIDGSPILGEAVDLTHELHARDEADRRSPFGIWILAVLALPLVGGAAWLFGGGLGESPEEDPRTLTAAGAARPDATSARPDAAAPDAAAPVPPDASRFDAGRPDAKSKTEPSKPSSPAKPKAREFVISVNTKGVTVRDQAGRRIGVASPILRVKTGKKRSYVLQKAGFYDQAFSINPRNSPTNLSFKLRPKPTAIQRPTPVASPAPARPTSPTSSRTPRSTASREEGRRRRRDIDHR